MGIAVAELTVRLAVRQTRPQRQPGFVPRHFEPGERAEFDFGHAVVKLDGQQREALRRELVARRSDGNREFARILHLCLTYSIKQVNAALELARRRSRRPRPGPLGSLVWPVLAPRPRDRACDSRHGSRHGSIHLLSPAAHRKQ